VYLLIRLCARVFSCRLTTCVTLSNLRSSLLCMATPLLLQVVNEQGEHEYVTDYEASTSTTPASQRGRVRRPLMTMMCGWR